MAWPFVEIFERHPSAEGERGLERDAGDGHREVASGKSELDHVAGLQGAFSAERTFDRRPVRGGGRLLGGRGCGTGAQCEGEENGIMDVRWPEHACLHE